LQVYETTVVVDSLLKPDDLRDLREKIVSFISNHGGSILKVEEWGKRRLAYEIAKKQYGYYLHTRFSAPPALIALLEREYRLNESYLRFLTIGVDKLALRQEALLAQRAKQEAEEAGKTAAASAAPA